MQLGMARVAERVTARALGEKPVPRVIEVAASPDIRQPLDGSNNESRIGAQVIDFWRPRPALSLPKFIVNFRRTTPDTSQIMSLCPQNRIPVSQGVQTCPCPILLIRR
jgi:hypothetical protein